MKLDRRRLADLAAGVLIGSLAFHAGRSAFAAAPTQGFYQSEFGPAVMIAVGAGFVNPEPVVGGPLHGFLAGRLSTLEPAIPDAVRILAPDQFQNAHRYLLTTIGWWWRATGISWARLAEVAGAAHLLAVLSVFALLRLFVPLGPAALGALWFASSPLQLAYAPHLRDFAKGAFVLAVVPLLVGLVLRAKSHVAVASVAAAAGAMIGIGLGFKMDVAIMAPVTVACVVLFRGHRPWHGLGQKALAVAALVLALVVTSWPVVSRLSSGGSNAIHVVLLGYSDWFDTRLGIEPAPYSLTPFYSDSYLRNVLRIRAKEASGQDSPMPSVAYDAAAIDLWRQWIRHFPADVYTRLLAAVDGVLNLAFDNPGPAGNGPPWFLTRMLSGFYEWLGGWSGRGWLLGLGLVFAAGLGGPGRALFAAVLIMALAGYPSLQYDPRHYFHLQAIPIAIIVVLVSSLLAAPLAWFRRNQVETAGVAASRGGSLRGAAMAAVLIVGGLTVLPVASLRAYQSNHLTAVFETSLKGDRVALDVEFTPLGPDRWLARWPSVDGMASTIPGLKTAYYLAEFRATEPHSAMAIGPSYAAAPDWAPCAVTRRLSSDQGVATFGFPVYSLEGESAFAGIEMGSEMRSRLIGIYRVPAGPAGLPVEVRLGGNWQSHKLFQRLVREQYLGIDDVGVGMSGVIERCGSQVPVIDALLNPALVPKQGDVATIYSPDIEVASDGLRVTATADASSAYLVRFKAQHFDVGDALVARVSMERGTVGIGLLTNGTLHQYAVSVQPGQSVVAIRATVAGSYEPLIASADPGWRSALRFTLDRLAIIRADGRVTAVGQLP